MLGLKAEVRQFWGSNPCGTEATRSEKFSLEYFEEIEAYRYRTEPQIFSFAQFSRFQGLKVLEVGVGAGSDFLQWVRSGAQAYGVDVTVESIEHVGKRLALYGLEARDLRVADAESLPYPDDYFDLVYSWGVIHHSPDTVKALAEIVRVTKPGGKNKLMVYNRHSLGAIYLWLKYALLRGRPWRTIGWCLHHFQESPGTKGYTAKEFDAILRGLPVRDVNIRALMSTVDTLELSAKSYVRLFGGAMSRLFGGRGVGWFLTIESVKQR